VNNWKEKNNKVKQIISTNIDDIPNIKVCINSNLLQFILTVLLFLLLLCLFLAVAASAAARSVTSSIYSSYGEYSSEIQQLENECEKQFRKLKHETKARFYPVVPINTKPKITQK
jgi:hypothetical protein